MTGVKVSWCLFAICLVSVFEQSRQTHIECIPLKDCPMAMNLVKTQKYAPKTIEFLKNSHCGIVNHEPLIFCPGFVGCKTRHFENGTCAHVHNCTPLTKIANELGLNEFARMQFFERHRCYSPYDDDFRVCCPKEDLYDDDNSVFDRSGHSHFGLRPSIGDRTTESSVDYESSEETDNFEGFDKDSTNTIDDTLPSPANEECGISITDTNRITGGKTTELGEFPWMAVFLYEGEKDTVNGCGGSLINDKYILTAAHCLHQDILRSKNLKKLKHIVLGEYDLKNDTDCIWDQCSDSPLYYSVKKAILHPEFSNVSYSNDIALVELDKRVKYSEYIRPICLPERNIRFNGNESLTIAGWGQTSTSFHSNTKQKARVKLNAKSEDCKNLDRTKICAGTGNGRDTCRGDSGGPLMFGEFQGSNFINYLIGVTSYGYVPCGARPSFFSYVPAYLDWIKENIK